MKTAPAYTPVVCILAAGQGTRMGSCYTALNKALLPIGQRAIISRIVEQFPPQTEFVVALGHRGEQVRQYLAMAHPETKITLVEVDKYKGPGSGPGYSLLCCRPHLERPFFFVACDTLWQTPLDFSLNSDWFAVAQVPADVSSRYCNFRTENGRIVEIHDKKRVEGSEYAAFTGLCFIKSYELFWSALTKKDLIQGEHQVSNGIQALVQERKPYALSIDWLDVGDAEKYEGVLKLSHEFDFSKPNEAIYIVNGRVIKFFADEAVTEKRVRRAKQNSLVFPKIREHSGSFYCYDLLPGQTLYEVCTPAIFKRFLSWLDKNLWRPVEVSADRMRMLCRDFYQKKTLERLNLYAKKYPGSGGPMRINGIDVPALEELLSHVDWELLSSGVPVMFHGDLQFDNVLYDVAGAATGQGFKLLDWRQDFAGEVEFGDLYYDLAKLMGGTILNYDLIKRNLLSYSESEGEAVFDYAQRLQGETYRTLIREYAASRALSEEKLSLLVPVIFLNMSPLHTAPFDRLLFALGRLLLAEHLGLSARRSNSELARDLRVDVTPRSKAELNAQSVEGSVASQTLQSKSPSIVLNSDQKDRA